MGEKTEFHCHTSNSADCCIDLESRIIQYKEKGFDFLAITDHDAVIKRSDWDFLCKQDGGLTVIPGIEVSTFLGHVILLGCMKRPPVNFLFFLVVWSHFYGAKIYIPHPVKIGTGFISCYMNSPLPVWYVRWFLGRVKYIEVWNPRDNAKNVLKIPEWLYAAFKGKCYTVASDAHFDDDIYDPGCPLGGLALGDERVGFFFGRKVIAAPVSIRVSLRNVLRYFKSGIRYLIFGIKGKSIV